MTNKALELMISKLNKLGSSDREKVEIINQSIERRWAGVFALKSDEPIQQGRYGQPTQPNPYKLYNMENYGLKEIPQWAKLTRSIGSGAKRITQRLKFYYVLSNDGLSVCLAWECVPTYDETGAKYFPPNSYPCQPHEIKRLNKERARRLGIHEQKSVDKKVREQARQKLPF